MAVLSRHPRVVAAVLVGLSLLWSSPAMAGSISASDQGVSATLDYRGPLDQASGLTLRIAQAGVADLRESVVSSLCGHHCWPAPLGRTLTVANLDGTRPDVVLSLYSGGAHCCFVDQVFALDASGRYEKSQVVLGDPTARLERLAPRGPLVFVTADDAFAYAFTDYAASGLPVKVLAFRDHHFVDVTGDYRSLIARDAARWWRAFAATAPTHYADSVGLVAAWAADEDRLGRVAVVSRVLAAQARAGHLNSALRPMAAGGRRFIAVLDRFLRQFAYRR